MSANPRILVLGAAGAGKSALLGSIARSAETQQDMGTVTFMDCDGRVAQEYLAGRRSLSDGAPLARSIQSADAVVLALAPAEGKQLEHACQQIDRFLNDFELDRGRRSEIAGLPVYLVLTKGDLLSRPDDTGAAWMQRLEESKRQLGLRFQPFFDHAKFSPFGQTELRIWATAIKRPEFTDRPSRPQEPYGVAELFRQVVVSARAFRTSRVRAQRRLSRSILGIMGLLALMGLVAAGFLLFRPSAAVAALENDVRATITAPAAERLREPLANRGKELAAMQANPAFAQLPPALHEEVLQATQELAVYQDLAKKVDILKRVRFFRKDEDIVAYKHALDNIVVPEHYAAEWASTRLAKKLVLYRAELDAVSAALAAEKEWLKDQNAIGDKLLRMAIPGAGTPERQAWIDSADIFLRSKDLTKPVPHVTNMKLKDLYEFPSLRAARADYDTIKARVAKIRGGLADA
jgi:hypothetical protein